MAFVYAVRPRCDLAPVPVDASVAQWTNDAVEKFVERSVPSAIVPVLRADREHALVHECLLSAMLSQMCGGDREWHALLCRYVWQCSNSIARKKYKYVALTSKVGAALPLIVKALGARAFTSVGMTRVRRAAMLALCPLYAHACARAAGRRS